ncbi:unnamed protein product [Caenorhabditis sp. 36 PRJEB53466]|nr:unnamed protein product [Caenorhabditis sp. 36 PRJEB53466]
MERVIDELEMISSPLAESEDSLISEMSTRHDVARSSWLELRGTRRRLEDGNESDFEDDDEIYGPPPLPERDYSRLRPLVYRKRGEEFAMRRSKSYERPGRPRTPEKKWTRNARNLVNKAKEINPVYATPIRKKVPAKVQPPIIEEFVEEVPRYVRPLRTAPEEVPVIDLSTEVEFSSKVPDKPREFKREDSLTSLLKRQLSSKKERLLPEYVEPKDPIIKELQEFLKIAPKPESQTETASTGESSSSTRSTSTTSTVIQKDISSEEKEGVQVAVPKEKAVQADEHRLIVRGWQALLKSSSSSTTSSTSSTTV